MLRRVALLITTVLALGAGGGTAQAASIWTPISSGTNGTITSIVYQSPTRFWYATSGGTIAYFNGTGFSEATGTHPGEDFVDMAFQPTSVPGGPGTVGLVGFAVTANGGVLHSTDGGVEWVAIASPSTRTDCTVSSTAVAESELNAVQWASNTTVFLLGDNSTILRSTAATGNTPTFTEIDKNGATCAMQNETSAQDMTDATFLPGDPDDALFVTRDFGRLYESADASTAGAPTGSLVDDDTVNSFDGNPRIARDPVNPNRIWVVDHATPATCGTLCLEMSTDGGKFTTAASFPNDATVKGNLYDVSSQGGVEVTAGSGGEIFTSVDGTNFYDQPAEGSLAAENWYAEAAYDAQHAAVGGENGALAITAAANTIPTSATPPGTSPGTTVGGSGGPARSGPPPGPPTVSKPIQLDLAGARTTIYRVVTVTGRNARFVPVVFSTTKPRKFVVRILPLKGKKALATGRLTLRHRHGGHGTIHVQLPAAVKPGTYFVVVRETTLAGKPVGKLVKVKFTLK